MTDLVPALLLATVPLAGLALLGRACLRELRAIRVALVALDEDGGRRAATLVAGLSALRAPLDALRSGGAGPSLQEGAPPQASFPAPRRSLHPVSPPVSGLRLDLPRANDEDDDSEGETRLVRQPTAAELEAAGATRPTVPPPPISAARRTDRRSACRLCAAQGTVRVRGGALTTCTGCEGSGFVDPARAPVPLDEERLARLPA